MFRQRDCECNPLYTFSLKSKVAKRCVIRLFLTQHNCLTNYISCQFCLDCFVQVRVYQQFSLSCNAINQHLEKIHLCFCLSIYFKWLSQYHHISLQATDQQPLALLCSQMGRQGFAIQCLTTWLPAENRTNIYYFVSQIGRMLGSFPITVLNCFLGYRHLQHFINTSTLSTIRQYDCECNPQVFLYKALTMMLYLSV